MADLYLLFFIFGAVLFAAIVLYSLLQQKGREKSRVSKTVSLDDLKSAKSKTVSSKAAKEDVPTDESVKKAPTISKKEANNTKESALSSTPQKTEAAKKTGAVSKAQAALSAIKSAPAELSRSASEKTKKTEPALVDPVTEDNKKARSSNDTSPQASTSNTNVTISSDNGVITDLVAKVMNPEPIEQNDLLSLFREHDFKFQRKVNIYGLNELTDMWRDVEFELPSARFLELGISIQLCDRDGAMSQKELHDFQQMVLQFCERYDAPFEFSMDIEEALLQAQALDQVGRRYDSMAVLNVVPRSKNGFRMADIQSCARDLMMSSDKNGIFMKTEGQKNNITVLYRLACTDGEGHFGIQATNHSTSKSVHDLVIYMNVPATREPELVFQEMVKDANDLATWLDGKVVDRSGKTMTQRTYSTLMQQISDIAYSMQQEGLIPGDAVAKKLF